MSAREKTKLAYFVSHPIQYQTPLLRRLAEEPDLDLRVFFWSDLSVKGYRDSGFGGVEVKWDVPLLEGYEYEFLPVIRPMKEVTLTEPINGGIFRALRRGKFDAVWVHGYWNLNCWIAFLSAKILGIPVLERSEGTLIDRPRSSAKLHIKRLFFRLLRPLLGAVLPIGSLNSDYWTYYLGADFPAFPVPYAVDNAFFQRQSTEAARTRYELRRQLGLEDGRPVILYASKLMERKRCIDLANAYIAMRPGPDGRKAYLLIVGDGTERVPVQSRLEEAGEKEVRFLGFQNQTQLGRFYDLCDFFVLPSVHEPFGLIVNEVMNAGRAVVVSDEVGCQRDLVEDGITGRVFPGRNVDALRKVLEEMVADPESCRLMGQRALTRVKQWSFEEDVAGLRAALNYVTGLPLQPHARETIMVSGNSAPRA